VTLSQRLQARVGRGGAPDVVAGTAGTLALNTATLALGFVTTVLLSRLLGATGYGAYAFAVAWATLLTAFAGLGLSPLVVRNVASASATARWGELRGVLRWANVVVLGTALVTIVAAAIAGLALLQNGNVLLQPFLVGLLLVAPLSLTTLRQSAMQGLGKVVLGRVPETLVAPGLFVGIAVTTNLALAGGLSAASTVAAQLLATIVAFALGTVLLMRSLPQPARMAAPEIHGRDWSRSAVPFFVIGLLSSANTQVGLLVLGTVGDVADAGVFAVAARTTSFVGFLMLAATYPLMPTLARIHANGDTARLRHAVTRSARVIVLLTLPVAVLIAVFAHPILSILFGAEFGAGTTATRILVIGEVARVVVGVAAIALLMSGFEADLSRALALGAIANVLLAITLVPALGVDGAAIAQTAGAILSSLALAWLARRRIGVSVLAIARRRTRS